MTDTDFESQPTVKTEVQPGLPLDVPVSLPIISAWPGGEHDGSRLTSEQRSEIRQLWVEGHSRKKIAEMTKHSRNTVREVIAPSAEVAEHLRNSRAARMLIEEEDMLRLRSELIEAKGDKVSISDVNSALMIGGIAIKDAGGAAPLKVEMKIEHEFHMAAGLMAGGLVEQKAVVFAPAPPVLEVEYADIEKGSGGAAEKFQN